MTSAARAPVGRSQWRSLRCNSEHSRSATTEPTSAPDRFRPDEDLVKKQAWTSQSFKPTVRLFKRWAKQYFAGTDVAPSFYIECAVLAVASGKFSTYLPRCFAQVGEDICSWSTHKIVLSIAGDKDILTAQEWPQAKFLTFQTRLRTDVSIVRRGLGAVTTEEANRLWKLAFGE